MQIKAMPNDASQEVAINLTFRRAQEIIALLSASAASCAATVSSRLPEAKSSWAFGPEDWARRGHAVFSISVLASTAQRLLYDPEEASFAHEESIGNLFTTLIPVTHGIAVGIPAGVDAEARRRFLKMLETPGIAQAIRTVDQDLSLAVDARSQVLLSEAGLIQSYSGRNGTAWRLVQRPITPASLQSVKDWYVEMVSLCAQHIQEMLLNAGDRVTQQERSAFVLLACGEISRHIPIPGSGKDGGGGLASLLGRLLSGGSSRVLGMSLWAQPWEIWDLCRTLGKMG